MSDTKQFLDKDGLDALWGKMCETFPHKDALGNYLPLAGGTLNINAHNETFEDVTNSNATTAWNVRPGLKIRNNNNTLAFWTAGKTNERTAYIQSGHVSQTYASSVGPLHLNPFGGNVVFGKSVEIANGNVTTTNGKSIVFENPWYAPDGGNWSKTQLYCRGPKDSNGNSKKIYSLGSFGTDDSLTYIYLGVNAYNSENNLKIYPDGHISAPSFTGHLDGTIKMAAGTANDYRDILVTNGSNGVCYSEAHNVQLNYATGDVKATSFTGTLKGTANIAKTLPYFKIESNRELPENKLPEYVKFATITIPTTSWARRSVTLFFQDHESLGYQGDILTIQVSSDGNGVGIMPNVKWVTKYKKSTIGNIVISKISSNVYDLYLEATTLSYITLRVFYLTINDVGEGKTFYFIDNANTWSTTAPVITARSTLNNVASSLANAKTIWGQSFDGTDNVSGDMTNVGSISMSKALTITGTDASTANLHFGRESYNYISGPSGSTIHMCPGGIAKDSTHGYIFGSTEFYPGTTNAYSIGTDTKKWKNVYATTFTGNLTGNASSAGTIKIYNSNNAGNYPLTFVSTTNEENQALYVSPTNQLTFQPSTGTLKAKTFTGTNASLTGPLTITGTANSTVASINFSRGSETDTTWNYITAPLGGNIVIAPNGVDKSSTKGYHFGGTSLYPGVNSTNVDTGYNLGNDTHKWKDAYIRTIHANNLTFIGTAHPHIGGNGESLSLGYSPTISSQMVFVEGAIRRNTSNTSTTLGTSQYPWPTIFSDITKTKSIAFQGDDTDRILMRVAAGNTDPDAIGNYGYTLKYLGSGTGINNALALYVDNEKGAEQLLGTKWTNDGKMYSRSIIPHTKDTYNLGATDKKWLTVYANTFTGDAATATAMSSFSAVSSSTTKRYVWMSYNDNSGKPAYSDKLTFQTSTNTLFSTNFSGNLTGDVTGDITGNAGSASKIYINTSSTNSYYPMTFVTATGTGNKSLYIDSSTDTASDSYGIRYNPSSNACYCSGGFYEASDERLKNFGDDIEVDLDKLSQLSKKYFTWKDDKSNVQQIGISAQELQKLYPELVNVIDEEGHLSVSYDKLSVIALKGIDVLNDKVKSLEERFERLEKLIKE